MAPDPMAPLDRLVAPRPAAEPGRFVTDFPEGWNQGRGLFGGLVIGTMVRAAEAIVPPEARRLRVVTATLCGATQPGAAALETEVLRAGKNVTTVAVRLVQAGAVQAHAVAVLGPPRTAAGELRGLEPPRLPPWASIEPARLDVPGAPTFARHFEYRLTGPAPFSSAAEARAEGWIRPRRAGPTRDAAFVAACVDAYWPSFYACWSAPRPVGTISFTLDVVGDAAALDPVAPLAYRARTLASHDGWALERRELWTEGGELLALNPQTIVVIR